MAKTWYQIIQDRTYGVVHALKMSGHAVVARIQLYTDAAYTDAAIIARLDAEAPAAQGQHGVTDLDRWLAGMRPAYDTIRELDAHDPLPRLGGIIAPEPLDTLWGVADERLRAFSAQYWSEQAQAGR